MFEDRSQFHATVKKKVFLNYFSTFAKSSVNLRLQQHFHLLLYRDFCFAVSVFNCQTAINAAVTLTVCMCISMYHLPSHFFVFEYFLQSWLPLKT